MQEEDKGQTGRKALFFKLRGEEPGSAHVLPEGVFRIGSDEDNDLVLGDRDVMPSQLEVRFVEDRYLLKNLSTDGSVFLNGEPFEESTLQKGDILTVGESMFRYVDRGETLSQEDLWRPVGGKQGVSDTRKMPLRRISFIMVLSLVAVGLVLVILFTQGRQVDTIQQMTGGKLADLEKPVDREELKIDYESGKDLLAARRWDEAIVVFEGIRKQMPNFMEVENLYQEALWESEYVDILNHGKGLVLEEEFIDARDQMEQVPRKSVYFREAERLGREIDEMILAKRLREAMAALARQDWSFAKSEAEAILAKYPNNKEARRIVLEARLLQRQLSDKKSGVHTAWSPRRPTAGPPTEGQRSRRPPGSPAEPAEEIVPKPPTGPIQRAIADYRKGETKKSLARLEKVLNGSRGEEGAKAKKAKELVEDLRSAVTYFQQAKNLQQAGRYSEAVEIWQRFLERDHRIAGNRGGSYFREASVCLGKIYFDRGRKEFDRGNPIGAALFWKMGREISPKDRDLRRGMGQLDEVARKTYREGYSLQEINVEEAIEKWKEVLMIVPPGHTYYKKAKRRIDRYAESP